MSTMAMFPLGSVLFPTMVLPLHVFEERYRGLLADCLAGEQEFGVCLIERGSEVGGGELRTDIGTVAQIVDAQQFDDGRWAIACVGTRRIRVRAWLDDDPYPMAEVEDWIDPTPRTDLSTERDLAVTRLVDVLTLQAELGIPGASPATTIDTDPTLASYQVAALSPMGPFDRQRLLGAGDAGERLSLLVSMLAEAEADLRAQQQLE